MSLPVTKIENFRNFILEDGFIVSENLIILDLIETVIELLPWQYKFNRK